MERPLNPACRGCDYAPGCHKKLKVGGEELLVKEQDLYRVTCVSVVQDVCRDCLHFARKRCASWRTLNGKPHAAKLSRCPKKVPVESR